MLKNISNFNNLSDYLPILNGAILADIVIIILLYYTKVFGDLPSLKKWYEKYRLSAVLADVLILVIGLILARYVYYKIFNEYSFAKFLFLVVVIQIIHDFLFYKLIIKPLPKGKNNMIDLFKEYSKDVKGGAILGDSFMIIITVLFSSYFANFNTNGNIILSVSLLYILPYVLYIR